MRKLRLVKYIAKGHVSGKYIQTLVCLILLVWALFFVVFPFTCVLESPMKFTKIPAPWAPIL